MYIVYNDKSARSLIERVLVGTIELDKWVNDLDYCFIKY